MLGILSAGILDFWVSGGWRVRTPGSLERRNGGVVCWIEFLHTPKPPHGRLICNEKDVNQGVTDPRRLWNPTEEN